MTIPETLFKLSDAADQDVKEFACNDVAQSAAATRRAIYTAAALLAELLEEKFPTPKCGNQEFYISNGPDRTLVRVCTFAPGHAGKCDI